MSDNYDSICGRCWTAQATRVVGVGWDEEFDAPIVELYCDDCIRPTDGDPAITAELIRRFRR